jgi:hypothetical protein
MACLMAGAGTLLQSVLQGTGKQAGRQAGKQAPLAAPAHPRAIMGAGNAVLAAGLQQLDAHAWQRRGTEHPGRLLGPSCSHRWHPDRACPQGRRLLVSGPAIATTAAARDRMLQA